MSNVRSMLVTGAAVAAAAVGGAAIANAASNSSTSSSTGATNTQAPPAFQNMPAHGSAAHEDAEKPVTGDAATKARAAAVKTAGGGTATEVTTDFTNTGYEVTVKKSDGKTVEIHMDKSYNVRPGHAQGGSVGPAAPATTGA